MTMQRYDLSAAKNQVCLDGTPGVFYMRNGTGSGARKYYVHYQGGGWCESPARGLTGSGDFTWFPYSHGFLAVSLLNTE
eukprot:COSAG06_NODE_8666_length_2102_cov_2.019970_1_plen_79_part_00